MSAPKGRLVIEKTNGIGYLTIDNPERRNAITAGMLKGFAEILPALDADDEIRVIVVRGNRDFAAGGDLSEASDPQTMADLSIAAFAAFGAVRKPLIAAIRGYCIGGGIGFAMKADIRIAARSARFSLPEARIGSTYPLSETKDLVREMGPSAVRLLMFTGDRITGEEAFEMGMVNRVIDDEMFDEEVASIAAKIAANAPLTINLVKATVKHITHGGDASVIEQMTEACMESEDSTEGLRAFAEKRAPRFIGR